MHNLEFIKFEKVNAQAFLPILNKLKLREHLMQHELFDINSAKQWMQSKIQVNSHDGCKVRAIKFNNQLIGWCGIQFEEDKFEIALVIDDKSWGLGVNIFKEIMSWAKELGHNYIYIHFLHTRPKYKFLQKIATQVYESELLGNKFTTYQLMVK